MTCCPSCKDRYETQAKQDELDTIYENIDWENASSEAKSFWAEIEKSQVGKHKTLGSLAAYIALCQITLEDVYLAQNQVKDNPTNAILLFATYLKGKIANCTEAEFDAHDLPRIHLESHVANQSPSSPVAFAGHHEYQRLDR